MKEGSARFLKSVKCRHLNGCLVIKVFTKPDPGMSLRTYQRRLKIEREALLDIANVCNHQAFIETEKAGYIVRQWVASNLYDRISTRPFLSLVEKRWIAFQLLNALRDARNRKISHGDIKSENILVTSWNWVLLSDFASYKPTYLPVDDPADFAFFFDISGRRTCYIAPERFYTTGMQDLRAPKSKIKMELIEEKREGIVTEAMDCFSAGCVIAELFLEGSPLFTLSELFKYIKGEFNVATHLSTIEDEGIRNLIIQMIVLDPCGRPTFDALLHTSRGRVFPDSFYSFFHNYVSSLNDISHQFTSVPSPSSSTMAITTLPLTLGTAIRPPTSSSSANLPTAENLPAASPNVADCRVEKLWSDYESFEPYITVGDGEVVSNVKFEYSIASTEFKPLESIFPVILCIPNRDLHLHQLSVVRRAAAEDGPALIVLASLTANIRNCSLPSSKVRAMDVLLAISAQLTDESKLDRMVPYIVELLHDEAAIVRASALRTLMQVIMSVTVITPSNAAIFPEYIIPNVKYLVQDPEVSVRCTYAQCIAQLADTAVRYLEMGQVLKTQGILKLSPNAQELDQAHFEISYDVCMQDLQNSFQEHLTTLLVDPSSAVKRAVLNDISSLCIFLGRQKTNDILLSHMITYLNDRDWLLRHAFFDSVVDIAACAGGRSLEEYILPLMIQSISDVEEAVLGKVLATLTSLCELGLFQKMRIWELMSATLSFLYHPNVWIKQGAVAFIVAATRHLPPSDVWCILYPSLRHFLKSDIVTIDEINMLNAIKPPLSRQVLDGAVRWAMKDDKASFWKVPRRHITSKSDSPRERVISSHKLPSSMSRIKSDEDEVQLDKLKQLGMTSNEETKLHAMRDYIVKLADATSSFVSRLSHEPHSDTDLYIAGDIELQKLGVVPQTIFLKSRSSDYPSRSSRPYFPNSFSGPVEDLRRRLAAINGSMTLFDHSHQQLSSITSLVNKQSGASSSPRSLSGPERPISPTESVLSATNSQLCRPSHRLHVGSTDGQKAAAAIGSSKTNATGVLEILPYVRAEESPQLSGRSSPVLMTTTLRGLQRARSPTLLPISTYDGKEPGINNLLENLYLDNNRELQQDFGPKIHEGPSRRRNVPRHMFNSSRDRAAMHTEATLVANLSSHSDTITGIAVSPDHIFFVTASDDKTVKVWDTARLERNVTSKPRHTYSQHHAKVKCVCILESSHCFISAAEDGSLHVVRVHTAQGAPLPKYTRLQAVREYRTSNRGEYITCMSHYNADGSSNLVYATTHSVVTTLDLRTMRILQSLQNPRHYGPITSLCIDRKRSWIVVGTSTGVLTLWDRRFGLLLRSWHVGSSSLGRQVRIHQCMVHPSKGKGKWVVVALESPKKVGSYSTIRLFEIWDIEKATLVETIVTRTCSSSLEPIQESHWTPVVIAESCPAAAIAALVVPQPPDGDFSPGIISRATSGESSLPPPPLPDVRAFVAGFEFGGQVGNRSDLDADLSGTRSSSRGFLCGYIVSGSEDRKLRIWDLAKVQRTVVLSGFESETSYERPSYQTLTAGTSSIHVETWLVSPGNIVQSNRPPHRMSLITNSQQKLLKSHQEVITALACVNSPFRGGIISGDRSGVVKVWRLDQFE